jgi:HEAT repeat protein
VEDIARIVRSVRDKFIHQEVIDVEAVKSTLIEALNRSELADIIHDTVILPLINKLKSDDRTALRRTVDILAEIKDERVVEPLIEKLVSAPTDIRKLIMVALGKIGDKRATTILTKIMLYSSNLDERIVAIRALAQIKDTKALEPLRKVSKDTTVVGKTAREVLEKF